MDAKIINQTKNPFLEREEITIQITNPTTPTYDEVKSAIGKDAALTIIKKINTNFGRQTFTAEAVVYDNAEAKKNIEVIPQKVKKKMEADEKSAAEAKAKEEAAPAEEPTPEPEAPTEVPTEEPKEETKPEEPKTE
jgi:ribosomal protein S24E